MRYLAFDPSEDTDGTVTLEALASTAEAQHAEVMAEVRQVLDWCWAQFPHGHGPVADGMDWDHDLQVQVEPDGWHAVTLTIAGSPAFAQAFAARFGVGDD
jgi:hypothetical protein